MAVGSRVGPYRILRLINRGGQGSVFLGYDHRLLRRVAIKIYRLPARSRARRIMLREARALASLDSPRVVAVHDVIESPAHLALVMEYVPGCDLEEFLDARRPSLASVVTIASDIATALAAARLAHVVHGDVKAANVLITETGRAKLTDFGISSFGASTPSRAASPSATSPEQYLGEGLDARTDLFALGCLMYRMLSGEAPFHREGSLDTRWLLERPPVPLAECVAAEYEVPAELLDLVMQMLARQPGDRPATLRPLRGALREVKRGLPLSSESSLLAEARPLFRPESPEDVPPPVPPDLGRGSRSRLAGGVPGFRWVPPGWRGAAMFALALLAVILPVGFMVSLDRETLVYIEAPSIDLEKFTDLPAAISAHWLVEQVTMALDRRLGTIRVDGPIGATTPTVYYAGDDPPEVRYDERLALYLHCREALCALAVSREQGGKRGVQHALLLPGVPQAQWADAVRSATDRLYD